MTDKAPPGRMLVISGPSGVGKTSICEGVMKRDPKVRYAVTATTRAPRPHETPGKDYFFFSRQDFLARKEAGFFWETQEYSGNLYGLPKSSVSSIVEAGDDALLAIDVRGFVEIKAQKPENLVSIFIMPPSLEVLKQRLSLRGEAQEQIERRCRIAEGELAYAPEYAHRVVNDDLARCIDETSGIIRESRRHS